MARPPRLSRDLLRAALQRLEAERQRVECQLQEVRSLLTADGIGSPRSSRPERHEAPERGRPERDRGRREEETGRLKAAARSRTADVWPVRLAMVAQPDAPVTPEVNQPEPRRSERLERHAEKMREKNAWVFRKRDAARAAWARRREQRKSQQETAKP